MIDEVNLHHIVGDFLGAKQPAFALICGDIAFDADVLICSERKTEFASRGRVLKYSLAGVAFVYKDVGFSYEDGFILTVLYICPQIT